MRRDIRAALLIATPFVAFVILFLLLPTAVAMWKALTPGGHLAFESLARAMSGTYRTSFMNSIQLSGVSALFGGLLGTLLALTLRYTERPAWLRSSADSWSAVASQLGGVPLAFAFIATIGTQGLLTKVFKQFGFDPVEAGISVSGFWGLVIVYLYFQIPLMFLVMMPAVHGLRDTWREAAAVLGASPLTYWRRVGVPLLMPAVLGGILLLFVNAFSAYATAYVLNSGGQLVPLQIRFLLQGNVISGEEDLGYAIVAWVILLLALALIGMTVLQRRTARWAQT